MPNLGNIVGFINDAMLAGNFSSRSFQTGNFNGIAEYIKTTDGGVEQKSPFIIDDQGEAMELIYDDRYPFVIFHLKDGWDYQQAPDPENYGKAGTTMQETANMKLVFVGSRKRMGVSCDNVTAAVAMDIPKEFTPSQLYGLSLVSCVIETGSVATDPYTIFSEIWSNTDYNFDTDTIIFTMSYKITATYNKGCFNLCTTIDDMYK